MSDCYVCDPIRALLVANGLTSFDGPVYVVHQHDPSCYARGALACPYADPDYLWGRGVEFAIVPKDGTAGLLSGNYETLFLHQFLDGDGNPISVDGYSGDIYASAAEAFGVTGEKVDGGVLWDIIEAYDRNGVRSEWKGALIGVDTNGTGARVFVNESEDIGADAYRSDAGNASPADYTWLRDGTRGWTEVAEPDTRTDWAGVRAVAFWFDGTVFSVSNEGGRPDSATVYLHVAAPDEFDAAVPGQRNYTAHNEILFSDRHIETDVSMTVLVKPVSIRLSVEADSGGLEMPRTGGAVSGIRVYKAAFVHGA